MRIIKKLVLTTLKIQVVRMGLMSAKVKMWVVQVGLAPVLIYIAFGKKNGMC